MAPLDVASQGVDHAFAPCRCFELAGNVLANPPVEVDQGSVDGRQSLPAGGLDHLHDLGEGVLE